MISSLFPRFFVGAASLTVFLNTPMWAQSAKPAPAPPSVPPVALSPLPTAKTPKTGTVDVVVMGNLASEKAHKLVAARSEMVGGALQQSARRFLPRVPADVTGGDLTLTMRVDPVRRNYFSVKLWGEDLDAGRLLLYIPLKSIDYQVGYRHDGDYLPLSVSASKPALPGRFFYSTALLPLPMTLGKTSLTFKIVSTGRLNPAGTGSEGNGGNYQLNMKAPSRGIYRAYTHTEPMLLPVGEIQGRAPVAQPRPAPGDEVLGPNGAFTTAVNARIAALLARPVDANAVTPADVLFLARSYSAPGLAGFKSAAVVAKVTAFIDAMALDGAANPDAAAEAGGEASIGGRFGALGTAISLLKTPLQPTLSTLIAGGESGSGKTSRRTAWANLLFASREFGRFNRHAPTSEAIVGDLSVYGANAGLVALGDGRAFPEADAMRYGREAAGLAPWLGSDLPEGGHEMPFGAHYFQVTRRGLTREWGYVGPSNGEMATRVLQMSELSSQNELRDRAVLMLKARAPFRRPAVEMVGAARYGAMEGIEGLSWRDEAESDGLSSIIAYGDVAVDGLRVAAASLDPVLVGYAKQMLADNQFFPALLADKSSAQNASAFDVFEDYPKIKAAKSEARLPMSAGRPDFAWSDEENGVLALRHGEERLWVAPFWQSKAGTGINGIGRFHFSTPLYDQVGTLETVPQFRPRGSFVRPASYIDTPAGFQWRPPNPPKQAFGGERLPLGRAPNDARDSEPFRGAVDFYAFRFGPFLVGLNRTGTRTYQLKTPAAFAAAPDLVTRSQLRGAIEVGPLSTVVLVLRGSIDETPIPIAPLAVRLNSSDSGAALEWNPASGAKSYTVMRGPSLDGPFETVRSGLTDTQFLDPQVADGTSFYTIVAVNANGESYQSMKVVNFSGTDGTQYPTEMGGMSGFAPRGAPGAVSEAGSGGPLGGGGDMGSADPFVVEGNTEEGVPDVPQGPSGPKPPPPAKPA